MDERTAAPRTGRRPIDGLERRPSCSRSMPWWRPTTRPWRPRGQRCAGSAARWTSRPSTTPPAPTSATTPRWGGSGSSSCPTSRPPPATWSTSTSTPSAVTLRWATTRCSGRCRPCSPPFRPTAGTPPRRRWSARPRPGRGFPTPPRSCVRRPTRSAAPGHRTSSPSPGTTGRWTDRARSRSSATAPICAPGLSAGVQDCQAMWAGGLGPDSP